MGHSGGINNVTEVKKQQHEYLYTEAVIMILKHGNKMKVITTVAKTAQHAATSENTCK